MKTKKSGLLIALFMFGISVAHAQVPGLTLGVKAGYIYSSMPAKWSAVTSKSGRSGYQIGAFARLGGKTFIQPELNYEGQSGNVTFNSANGSGTSTLKFRRLDIPVLLGHKFLALPLLNVRGYLGPDFGFKTGSGVSSTTSLDPSFYNFKSSTVGGIIGAGVDVGAITIDARYNLGFTKINEGFNTRLNSFVLAVGFKFL